MAWWMPYLSSSARYGSGSNASGPRTPAPCQSPRGEQLHGDDGIEASLPRDRAQTQLAPAFLRVGHLVQEDLARLAVLAADHPRSDDRPTGHLVAHLGGVGRDRGKDVARGYVDTLDADLVRAVHAQRVDGLELVDEVRAERVLERDLCAARHRRR